MQNVFDNKVNSFKLLYSVTIWGNSFGDKYSRNIYGKDIKKEK